MTRDIFDTNVSVYVGEDWRHFVRPIGSFLSAGVQHYPHHFARLRATYKAAIDAWAIGDEKLYHDYLDKYTRHKRDCPICLPQGINPNHNNTDFESYSDILCLDIDKEKPHKNPNGNEWVDDWENLKNELGRLPWVAYCGLSASGNGLFALIPIASHTNHEYHWAALRTALKKHLNISVDPSTRNIGRLRFMSADPRPIINHNAKVWEGIEKPQPQRPRPVTWRQNDDLDRVGRCVQQICARGIDITQSHEEWKKASAAIAHTYGEQGREMFHAIASQYPGYKRKENDVLYSNLMRGAASQCSINTFFYLCKRYGIDIGSERVERYPLPKASKPKPIRKQISSPQAEALDKILTRHPLLCEMLFKPLDLVPTDPQAEEIFDAFMNEHEQPPF